MNNEEFVSYLKTVLQLEKNKYTLNMSLEQTGDNMERVTDAMERSMRRQDNKKPTETERSGSELGYMVGGGFVLALAGLMALPIIQDLAEGRGIFGLGVVMLFFLGAIGIGLIAYSMHLKNDRSRYDAKKREEYTNVIEEEEKRRDRGAAYGKHLIAVSEKLEKQLDATEATLKKLYSINIIHPKYQNLIAIASFCEYFETGRCTQLEGHEGAYNIFENEVRLDKIITNQERILDSLDQIKNNQYTLYCAMRESQYQLERISGKLDRVMSLSEQTAQNSAITAYNTKCSADNTAALNSYMFWRDVLR